MTWYWWIIGAVGLTAFLLVWPWFMRAFGSYVEWVEGVGNKRRW